MTDPEIMPQETLANLMAVVWSDRMCNQLKGWMSGLLTVPEIRYQLALFLETMLTDKEREEMAAVGKLARERGEQLPWPPQPKDNPFA